MQDRRVRHTVNGLKYLVMLLCMLPPPGCDKAPAKRPAAHTPARTPSTPALPDNLPQDRVVSIQDTFTDYEDQGHVRDKRESTARGAGAAVEGDKAALQTSFDAPTLSDGDSSASGGGSRGSASAEAISGHAASPLVWLAALCLIGSGVLFYFRMLREALFAGAGAAALFVAAIILTNPVAQLVVVGVVLVGGCIALLYFLKQGKNGTEAARATVAGIGSLKATNPDAYAAAKVAVAQFVEKSGPIDDAKTISRIKEADNIR